MTGFGSAKLMFKRLLTIGAVKAKVKSGLAWREIGRLSGNNKGAFNRNRYAPSPVYMGAKAPQILQLPVIIKGW